MINADQFDLFSGMVDRGTNGAVLRDRGIEQVKDNNVSWIQACIDVIPNLPLGDDFTGEDIRFLLEAEGLIPTHPNAWGALTNTLARRKLIVRTGEYRQPTDKSSHARAIQVYRRA